MFEYMSFSEFKHKVKDCILRNVLIKTGLVSASSKTSLSGVTRTFSDNEFMTIIATYFLADYSSSFNVSIECRRAKKFHITIVIDDISFVLGNLYDVHDFEQLITEYEEFFGSPINDMIYDGIAHEKSVLGKMLE